MKDTMKKALATIGKEVVLDVVITVGKRLMDMGILLRNEHLNNLRGSSDTGLWPKEMSGPPVQGGSTSSVATTSDGETTRLS